MKLRSALSLLSLCACTFPALAEAKDVTFDWFEYSGQQAAGTPEKGAGDFSNPILAGFYPDPSLCRVGEDYYLINSTFAYYPGIPIFHSRDLVNWTQIGNVIHRPNQLPYKGVGVSRAIFAPAISHHDGTFYVVCTMIDAGGNFVVTAKDPRGPWSDPTWLHFEGIDPSLFFDDDGRAWMLNNGAPEGKPLYDGHRAIWIQEFDYKAKKMVGPRKLLVNGGVDISTKPVWIEGPHIYKREGWYYLCCAEGGTSVNHSQVILRSRKVDGPYVPWEGNPIITQRDLDGNAPLSVTSTGHADLEIGPDGNWWAVLLAVRPYEGRYSPMGRETFLLPVTWTDDGWPRILEKGKRVPLVVKAPRTKASPSPRPLNGESFSWRDDFQGRELAPEWIMLRAPLETWWKLGAPEGRLALTPRTEKLSGKGNPSYLGRRVHHAKFSASTALDAPQEAEVSAGLAVFQGERYHYFLSVRREGDGAVIELEKLRGGSGEVIASARVPSTGQIQLRTEADNALCAFSYAAGDGKWQTLVKDADAKLLTTDVAGGFVGATVGVHARRNIAAALDPQIVGEGARQKQTFVLVHGAWAGGWEWKKFAQVLQAAGHTVHRVTLSGQGERHHLATRDIDLETHIQDVVNFIEWEDLRDFVLVGHSYGGMVITGVADRVHGRLKKVIYVDAAIPEDGENAQTAFSPGRPPRQAVNGFFPLGNHKDLPVPHVVPMPEKTFTQPIQLKNQDAARKVDTLYILTVDTGKQPKDDGFFHFHERAQARNWKTIIMEGDHVVHLTQPEELARLLVSTP